MLKVTISKHVLVNFFDLEIEKAILTELGCEITRVRSFGIGSFKFFHLIDYTKHEIPSLSQVCKYIESATLGNQNLSEIYVFMAEFGRYYSRSHFGMIEELFNKKEQELVVELLKRFQKPLI